MQDVGFGADAGEGADDATRSLVDGETTGDSSPIEDASSSAPLGSNDGTVDTESGTTDSDASESASESPTEAEDTSATSGATDPASTEPDLTSIDTSQMDAGAPVDPLPPIPPSWAAANELFSRAGIARFELTLDTLALEALQVDPYVYVQGDVEVELADGTLISLPDSGVRLKGRVGSQRELYAKPSFLIKTNEFVDGQELLGMKKVALNNMVQDWSMIREQLSYDLFRAMDVPAPRTGYAQVRLNAGPVALYASVEVVDNEEYLQRWFGSDEGNLYEGEYGTDLTQEGVQHFDQDRGEDIGFADLYELSDALATMTNPETLLSDLGTVIDVDRYLRFAATELYLSHWDGYAWTRNNYFIYQAPGELWTFMPWGTDQTFDTLEMGIWGGQGLVQTLCDASQACRTRMGQVYAEVMALVDELDLVGRVDELEAMIADAAAQDELREQPVEEITATIERVRTFLRDRPAIIDGELACLRPSDVDADSDGSSGCNQDCNDGDPEIYPGAPERCNLVDDDCDGALDEEAGCPECVEAQTESGALYAYCFIAKPWQGAADDCVARGGRLVSVHDQQQADELVQGANNVLPGEWWIGLSDQAEEGNFVWEDQTALDFQSWAEAEPNNAGDSEHCAQMRSDGLWNDLGCDAQLGYICRLP